MDRADMINSLAEAMGVKTVKEETEFSKKYNTSTGTIYCNRKIADFDKEEDKLLIEAVSLFPARKMAM